MPVITPFTRPKCSQCGNDLIEVKTVTEKVENHRFPVTVTTYRCSDEKCQEETDKRTAARVRNTTQQELAKQERERVRTKNMEAKRALAKKAAKLH